MKEILQTKVFKTLSICCLCICSCMYLHPYHVENVARNPQAIEVEDPEAEYQEQPEQEYEVADQVSDQELSKASPGAF